MYKTRLLSYQDSYNQLNHVMSLSDQTRVNKSLRRFNEEQTHEKDFINELYFKFKNSSPRIVHHAFTDSSHMLNTSPPTAIAIQPTASAAYFTPQRAIEVKNGVLGKSYDNLYTQINQVSTPTSSNVGGFVQNHLRSFLSHSRLADPSHSRAAPQSNQTDVNSDEARNASTLPSGPKHSKTFKVGYLFKRSHHSHVKNWLKRRCQSENGFFYIFHSDETKEPVKLNLVISNIKVKFDFMISCVLFE
jgi:hypothetical protein